VKEAVLPFSRFAGVDTTLGPEMKSTGEVMGVGRSFPEAFAKASLAAGDRLPRQGAVFMSVADAEKDAAILMALLLSTLGFRILATEGTHRALILNGIDSEPVLKHTDGLALRAGHMAMQAAATLGEASVELAPATLVSAGLAAAAGVMADGPEGAPPITTIVDLIEDGQVDLVINIPRGRGARADGYEIRRAALRRGVPTMTNAAAAHAAVQAIAQARKNGVTRVVCLQELHGRLAAEAAGGYAAGGGGRP
jgi:carbamoyl-phosphate synthase large subunit